MDSKAPSHPQAELEALLGAHGCTLDDVLRVEATVFDAASGTWLRGHGVPAALCARTRTAARAFFELPLEDKAAIAHLKKGYIPVGGCSNAVRPSELHEKVCSATLCSAVVCVCACVRVYVLASVCVCVCVCGSLTSSAWTGGVTS